MPNPRVTLTHDETMPDRNDAKRDASRARVNGWNGIGFHPGDDERLAYCARAYMAERAFAKFLGVKNYKRDKNGFGRSDVGGWSVRFASRPGYGLVVHARDGAYPYALVSGTEGPLTFEMTGWLTSHEARALRVHGKPLPGTTGAVAIPVGFVHSWELFKRDAIMFRSCLDAQR